MRYITELSEAELRQIGSSAQQRALAEHTNSGRAAEFESAIDHALSFSTVTNVGILSSAHHRRVRSLLNPCAVKKGRTSHSTFLSGRPEIPDCRGRDS